MNESGKENIAARRTEDRGFTDRGFDLCKNAKDLLDSVCS
jgi:hypothetical protein